MTENEILQLEQTYKEAKIQHICVCWFRMTFPKVANLLFAVPNGGWRGPRVGAQMVYEGQVRGVADLILLYPYGGKSSLCIEMKVPAKPRGRRKGIQSECQKEWQCLVEDYGSVYRLCYGLIEFIKAVCEYLQRDPQKYIAEALVKYPLYR